MGIFFNFGHDDDNDDDLIRNIKYYEKNPLYLMPDIPLSDDEKDCFLKLSKPALNMDKFKKYLVDNLGLKDENN